jgi:hypothetical protein
LAYHVPPLSPPSTALVAPIRSPGRLTTVTATHAEFRGLDDSPQILKVWEDVFGSFARKEDHEFFATAPIGLTAASYSRELCRNQTQNLVSGVVTVGVVEAFEVVDIDDGNRIWMFQPQQCIVKSSPGG